MASISTIISSPLPPPLAVLIGDHRRNNDAALDDFLVVRVDVKEREARRQNPEDDRPDDRSGHAADTARERGSADYGRGDRVEFETNADPGLPADGARRMHDAGEAGKQSRDHID